MSWKHIVGWLSVCALLLPGALPPASANQTPLVLSATVAHGAEASYLVTFPESGKLHGVDLRIGESGWCKDALLRPHECLNLTLTRTHAGIRQRAEPVGLSWAHGEVVSIGTWNLSLRHPYREAFVAQGPRWYASPLAIEHDGWPSELMDLYRVSLVGALTLPLRYGESGPGKITLAGTPGTLRATPEANGTLAITGVFRHEHANTTYAFSYTSRMGSEGGFPREVVLEELSPRPHVIAIAQRASHALGAGAPIELHDTVPAPAREPRPARFEPWASHPPDADSLLVLPLSEAARYAGVPATDAAYPTLPASRYLTFANYREAPAGPAHANLPDLGVPSTVGRWYLWEPSPEGHLSGEGRETSAPWIVTREVLHGEPALPVDTVRTGLPPGATPWSERWVPARHELAPTALPLRDAIEIARTLAPYHPQAFELKWEVTTHPAELGTPWETTITLQCGTEDYPSSVFSVILSATTGQLLSRTSWGHDACYVDL